MINSLVRFHDYDGKRFFKKGTKEPMNGDDLRKGIIFRYKNGYLDGGNYPAIETDEGYMEYRVKSILHRIGGPAVVGNNHIGTEYWVNGVQISEEKV